LGSIEAEAANGWLTCACPIPEEASKANRDEAAVEMIRLRTFIGSSPKQNE
jgi:hypothetical protein